MQHEEDDEADRRAGGVPILTPAQEKEASAAKAYWSNVAATPLIDEVGAAELQGLAERAEAAGRRVPQQCMAEEPKRADNLTTAMIAAAFAVLASPKYSPRLFRLEEVISGSGYLFDLDEPYYCVDTEDGELGDCDRYHAAFLAARAVLDERRLALAAARTEDERRAAAARFEWDDDDPLIEFGQSYDALTNYTRERPYLVGRAELLDARIGRLYSDASLRAQRLEPGSDIVPLYPEEWRPLVTERFFLQLAVTLMAAAAAAMDAISDFVDSMSLPVLPEGMLFGSAAGEADEKNFLVHPILAMGETVIVSGDAGAGKTTAIQTIAMHSAAGLDLGGLAISEAGAVLYCALEGSRRGKKAGRCVSQEEKIAG